MPSRNTYHLTWVSLTLDVGYLLPRTWGISSWLFQQRAATAPYLDKVAPPDLERGVAPLCLLMPSRKAYHLTWVSLTLDVGYLFTAAPAVHEL